MNPDHDTVLAAIEKARDIGHSNDCWWHTTLTDYPCACEQAERTAHCDDLLAIAERHAPRYYGYAGEPVCASARHPDWPCPDYRLVIDRLTKWGAL